MKTLGQATNGSVKVELRQDTEGGISFVIEGPAILRRRFTFSNLATWEVVPVQEVIVLGEEILKYHLRSAQELDDLIAEYLQEGWTEELLESTAVIQTVEDGWIECRDRLFWK